MWFDMELLMSTAGVRIALKRGQLRRERRAIGSAAQFRDPLGYLHRGEGSSPISGRAKVQRPRCMQA
jgi:hypothetical protein